MNKRQMGKMMRGAFTLSALSLSAADLTLVGDGTAVWNRSTANWKDANGQETRYADGDNVTIGGEDFTGTAAPNGWIPEMSCSATSRKSFSRRPRTSSGSGRTRSPCPNGAAVRCA